MVVVTTVSIKELQALTCADDILKGKYKILYTSEWLASTDGSFSEFKMGFLKTIQTKVGINLLTFDESHLLLDWSKPSFWLNFSLAWQ